MSLKEEIINCNNLSSFEKDYLINKNCCHECGDKLFEFEKANGELCMKCFLNQKINKEKKNNAMSYN